MDKQLEQESEKIKRAREKLKKRLDLIDDKINNNEIKKKSNEIHKWIARHASNRTVLKNKGISLFDENRNTAQISGNVSKLVKNLEKKINLDK